MSFKISLSASDLSFPAEPTESILDAALKAGLVLPYGCRDGACGSCKGRVLEGEIEPGDGVDTALSPEERAAGMVLFCQAQARSDAIIEARSVSRASDFPIKKLPCRVQRLERAADDVMVLEVKLPASEAFNFKAGQYIDFLLAEGRRRSFSIANAPGSADHLELHIRRVDGGSFTGQVFEKMKERDILRFEGPLGTFGFDDSDTPAILLAGGTGFAPLKGMIEDAIARGLRRPLMLYWGARQRSGLYMDALAQQWARELPDFHYVPVLSEPTAADAWEGRTGFVHEAVLADFADLSAHKVFACGAPAMIDAARRDFAARGLPDEAFYCDAFTFSPG